MQETSLEDILTYLTRTDPYIMKWNDGLDFKSVIGAFLEVIRGDPMAINSLAAEQLKELRGTLTAALQAMDKHKQVVFHCTVRKV